MCIKSGVCVTVYLAHGGVAVSISFAICGHAKGLWSDWIALVMHECTLAATSMQLPWLYSNVEN